MAKRSTIGQNPLDARFQENPLDVVVPDPVAARSGQRPGLTPELPQEAAARLGHLEGGVSQTQTQLTHLRGEVTTLRGEVSQLKGDIKPRQQESQALQAELARLKSEMSRLLTELAALKSELAQWKASQTPSDIPWWMGGRKKK